MTSRSLLSVTLVIDNFFPRAGSFSPTLCVCLSVCLCVCVCVFLLFGYRIDCAGWLDTSARRSSHEGGRGRGRLILIRSCVQSSDFLSGSFFLSF
jgi:hypothetical protein